jgi:protein-L-isoaspartate O-methyltransferase
VLTKFIYYRPRLEAILSAIDRDRLKLPIVNARLLFDDFDRQPVTLTILPTGAWSSPIVDVVMLAKIARCLKPRRVLEVGCYRGYTTRLLAEHTPPDTKIVAFDREPRHGEAYRDTPLAAKIERRIGSVSPAAFEMDAPGSYDLIFLDADHTYEAVKYDTEVLLPLVAPGGIFVWHDYANWGRFSKMNGVPEALHEFAGSRPIASVGGSWLAIHAPAWATPGGAARLANAREDATRDRPGEDPWETRSLRG